MILPEKVRLSRKTGGPRVSFEFFPPKTPEMEATLWESINRLAPLHPNFMSVTYGAGGTTRERTHSTVTRLIKETSIKPAAHLTCVGASRAEVDAVVDHYRAAGLIGVSLMRRATVACVRSRVEPPAP